MKKQIITATFLLTVTMLITSCGNNASENKTDKTEQAENALYQCPMKCEGDKVYNEPGQCPVCNMDLEKVQGVSEERDQDANSEES